MPVLGSCYPALARLNTRIESTVSAPAGTGARGASVADQCAGNAAELDEQVQAPLHALRDPDLVELAARPVDDLARELGDLRLVEAAALVGVGVVDVVGEVDR